ncbi:Centrosomal protein, partial [Stegodyphus mimosarum]
MAQHYENGYERQEEECLKFANCLVEKCKLSLPAVRCLKDIDCNLIVSLYENITGLTILDLLSCEDAVDEAHNIQAVIDALSLDLLGISLSHITGEDVVAGDVTAIYNLLEILEGIFLLTSGGKNSSTSSSYSVSSKKGIKRKISRLSSRKQKLQPGSVELAVTNENLRNKLDSSCISFGSTHSYASTSPSLGHEKTQSPVRSRDTYTDLSAGHKILRPKRIQRRVISAEISPLPSVDDVTSSVQPKLVSKVPDDHFQRSEREKKTKKEEQQQFIESPSVLNLIHTARKSKDSGSSQIRTKKAKTADPFHLKEDKGLQKKDVEELYEKNLENKIRLFLEKNSPVKKYASQTKKKYLKQMRKPMHRSSIKPCRKSFLLPHSLRHRSLSHTSAKEFHSHRCQLDGNVGKEKRMPKE